MKKQVSVYKILLRTKKYFASLHNLDRKIYLFPNTPAHLIALPPCLKICTTISDFKIKNIIGGFQRRPELLVGSKKEHIKTGISDYYSFCQRQYNKNQQIQHELVTMAFNFSQIVNDCAHNKPDGCSSMTETKRDIHKDFNVIPLMILDVGCGDGLSMEPILNQGHMCIGVDVQLNSLMEFKNYIIERNQGFHQFKEAFRNQISSAEIETSFNGKLSLYDAKIFNNNCSFKDYSQRADLIRWDLRYGLPFKNNSFDLAISISFLQWLFYGHWQEQLHLFFSSLKSVLISKGKAVIQFYPTSKTQVENVVSIAMRYFHGVLIGDYPHLNRGRKLFLILF